MLIKILIITKKKSIHLVNLLTTKDIHSYQQQNYPLIHFFKKKKNIHINVYTISKIFIITNCFRDLFYPISLHHCQLKRIEREQKRAKPKRGDFQFTFTAAIACLLYFWYSVIGVSVVYFVYPSMQILLSLLDLFS